MATSTSATVRAPVGGEGPAPRSGLTWRIFLASASVVGVVLVLTLVLSYIAADRQANATLRRDLDQTATRVTDLFDASSGDLVDRTRIYVGTPTFRSIIEQPKDSGDYLDQAQTMAQEIGASWVQLTDRDGTRLARSDEPDAERVSLMASSLVSDPLTEDKTASGFGATHDGVLFQAVGVPIKGAGNTPIGVAMASRNISDTLATLLAQETGSEVVFYALDSTGAMQIVGASQGIKDRSEVKTTLEPLILATNADSTKSGTTQDSARATDAARGTSMTPMREGSIDGERYAWSMRPFKAAGGRVVGGVIALRDKDKEFANFRRTQWLISGVGVLAILICFGASLAVARQITRPVRALVVATTRASEGDYAADIPASGTDEIGSLATAFRRLLADLREKQALVAFMQNTSGRTVPAHGNAPTLRMMMVDGTPTMLEPGQLLASRYEITSVLGVGGMGMVYKAMDRELGEIVAVKTLKPEMIKEDPAALERFRSEIRLARRISHRNVVRTHDIGESNGLYYITMEFVEGTALKDVIVKRGRLPTAAVLPIAKQLMRALDVAHEAGVIHRDIKPQNMVVEPDGVLKVMDFGIARMAERTGGHTRAGMIVGTPEYMAPEQLLGENVDSRADLYAAGVVLYESLTGKLPHTSETMMALIAKVIEETPVPPRALADHIPAPLSDLIMRTLSKDPKLRPKSAGDLLADLERM